MIAIKVPATTANLGVGFDCLGMALDLYAYFHFEPSDTLSITGCPVAYQDENNLVYQAYVKTMLFLEKKPTPIHLKIESDIPLERGLGSSSTCIVAGVLGAFALSNTPINQEKALAICTKLEGHPDNVVPALLGGLIASYQGKETVYTSQTLVHPSYQFHLLVPDFKTSTEKARGLLPKTIAFQDAVTNQSKLVFALKALSDGNGKLLQEVMTDNLHEPYRKQLIHDFDTIDEIAKEAGALSLLISGSGPSLLLISQKDIDIDYLKNQLKKLKHAWKCYKVKIDLEGAQSC